MSLRVGTEFRGTLMRIALAAVSTVALLMTPGTVVPLAGQTLGSASNPIRVPITAGRSTVIATDFDVTRIAVTNPAVADAVVVAQREILVDGKAPGTISLIVWGGGDRRLQYDVVVDQPVAALQQNLRNLFPGEDITVTTTEDATTLSGTVSSNEVMLRAGEIATKTLSKSSIINLLQVPGGQGSQQVLLQVRFAEVNRQALSEAGVGLFTGPSGYKNWVGRVTTQQFAAPDFEEDELTFSDFLNLFVFNNKYNVGGLLKALQTQGLLQSLAEPNLIAYNGKEASFLAGGEIPVPVVQGTGAAGGTVTIIYREFGIRLTFTPTIAGDVIRLKVRPEVSALDFANGVSLGGFRIPALTTRRADTEVELRDGQAFAIAGLINNIGQNDRSAVPLLSNLPILGALFKSRAIRQQKTELMVLITPHLVRPLNPDEVPTLPTDPSQFLDDEKFLSNGGAADAPSNTNPGR
jgi:pilus assembly protein CpaC